MYLVLLFATAALLGDCKSANVNKHMKLLAEFDNQIEPNGLPSKSSNKKFVAITHRPSATYTHEAGTTLTLTCIALGSPAPSVHWFKNDAPVYELDMESNEVIDSNPASVAEIRSSLLVTKSGVKDEYSCLATSGSKIARASTTVFGTDGSSEVSERRKLLPLAPRVVVSYKVYLDIIGNNVVLPCKAKGHPKPEVTWQDNRGVLVKNNPRMKVLRSGELVISSLRWNDMGGYSCQATNMFGTNTASTFLYPAKAS